MSQETKSVRVRFAPSPTGTMHIGNIRTALFNYLFAKNNDGTFILRVEDTDPKRNFDVGAKKIMANMAWLGLNYTEGPEAGGNFGPYFQSERLDFYKKSLEKLISSEAVYRCFCSEEELARKRERQIALKTPPRYDKACFKLSTEQINTNLENKLEFVWRAKVNPDSKIEFKDLARGTINFDLKNFSDFPLTRRDGSFTFMFANVVDDIEMQITHIFRGEDHLTNTVGQIVLYDALKVAHPIYWHMPILCNIDGKKLSKRDFGFSLQDLQDSGFLPEAIINYLATTGSSFKQEIMTLPELVEEINFKNISSTGQIKYDSEKLRWINHKWIANYNTAKLIELILPIISEKYPEAKNLNSEITTKLTELIKTDLVTLVDSTDLVKFYFETPSADQSQLKSTENLDKIKDLIKNNLPITDANTFLNKTKQGAKDLQVPLKELFPVLRLSLTGNTQGFGIKELIETMGIAESEKRIQRFIG